jgi:hypothetical protein
VTSIKTTPSVHHSRDLPFAIFDKVVSSLYHLMRILALILTCLLPFTFVVQAQSVVEVVECTCPISAKVDAVDCCQMAMKCCLGDESSSPQSGHPVEFQWSRSTLDLSPQLFQLSVLARLSADESSSARASSHFLHPTADPPPPSALRLCALKQTWLI